MAAADTGRCCLVVCSSEYATGALVVAHPGVVVDSAPIFRWCVGKDWPTVRAWFKSRPGATVTILPQLFAWQH